MLPTIVERPQVQQVTGNRSGLKNASRSNEVSRCTSIRSQSNILSYQLVRVRVKNDDRQGKAQAVQKASRNISPWSAPFNSRFLLAVQIEGNEGDEEEFTHGTGIHLRQPACRSAGTS